MKPFHSDPKESTPPSPGSIEASDSLPSVRPRAASSSGRLSNPSPSESSDDTARAAAAAAAASFGPLA